MTPVVLALAKALALGALVLLAGCGGAGARTGCVAGRSGGGTSGVCAGGAQRGGATTVRSGDAPRGETTVRSGGVPGRGSAPVRSGGAPSGGTTTVRSGSLTVKLVVAPTVAKAGSVVKIELLARAGRAPGALGYLLRYGDGTTGGSGAIPQFCIAGATPAAHQTWRLEHRYRARGRYVVSASVYVNCTHDRAMAMTPVLVR